MEGAFSFGEEGDLIKEGYEDIDGGVGCVFGEVGDKELMVVFFDPERGTFCVVGGGKNDIGEGEYFSLFFFCLVCAELIVLPMA